MAVLNGSIIKGIKLCIIEWYEIIVQAICYYWKHTFESLNAAGYPVPPAPSIRTSTSIIQLYYCY